MNSSEKRVDLDRLKTWQKHLNYEENPTKKLRLFCVIAEGYEELEDFDSSRKYLLRGADFFKKNSGSDSAYKEYGCRILTGLCKIYQNDEATEKLDLYAKYLKRFAESGKLYYFVSQSLIFLAMVRYIKAQNIKKEMEDRDFDSFFEKRKLDLTVEELLEASIELLVDASSTADVYRKLNTEVVKELDGQIALNLGITYMLYCKLDDKYFSKALTNLLEGKKIAKKSNNLILDCKCEYNLAILYSQKNEDQNAEKHIKEYIKMVKDTDNWDEEYRAREMLVLCYIDQHKLEDASHSIDVIRRFLRKKCPNNLLQEYLEMTDELSQRLAALTSELAVISDAIAPFLNLEGNYHRISLEEYTSLFNLLGEITFPESPLLKIFKSPSSTSTFSSELSIFLSYAISTSRASSNSSLLCSLLSSLLPLLPEPSLSLQVLSLLVSAPLSLLLPVGLRCSYYLDNALSLHSAGYPLFEVEEAFRRVEDLLRNREDEEASKQREEMLGNLELVYRDESQHEALAEVRRCINEGGWVRWKDVGQSRRARESEKQRRSSTLAQREMFRSEQEEENEVIAEVSDQHRKRVDQDIIRDLVGARSEKNSTALSISHRRHQNESVKPANMYFGSDEWFGCFNLQTLMRKFDLNMTRIGDSFIVELAKYINSHIDSYISPIEYVDISCSGVTGAGMEKLEDLSNFKLSLCENTVYFDISKNKILVNDKVASILRSVIYLSNETLEYYDISDLMLEEEVLVIIEDIIIVALSNMKALSILKLSNLSLSMIWQIDLTNSFSEGLTELDLSGNSFEADSTAYILVIRYKFPNLRVLNLSNQSSSISNLSSSLISTLSLLSPPSSYPLLSTLSLSSNAAFLEVLLLSRDGECLAPGLTSSLSGVCTLQVDNFPMKKAILLTNFFKFFEKKNTHQIRVLFRHCKSSWNPDLVQEIERLRLEQHQGVKAEFDFDL